MEQVENNVNIIGRYLGKNKEGVVIANVFFKPFVFTQASVDKNTYNKLLKASEEDWFELYDLPTREEVLELLKNIVRGNKGDRGDKGIKGEKGPQGIQGLQGEQGDPGDSGIQGERGIPGEQGFQGEQGEKGDRGDKGEMGDSCIEHLNEAKFSNLSLKEYLDNSFQELYHKIINPAFNTVNGSSFTVNNTIADKVDIKVCGVSIQNLWRNYYLNSSEKYNIIQSSDDNSTFTFVLSGTTYGYVLSNKSDMFLKPSTQYTFARQVSSLYPISEKIIIGLENGTEEEVDISHNEGGLLIDLIDTPINFSYLRYKIGYSIAKSYFSIGQIMILEGDKSYLLKSDNLSYFSGIMDTSLEQTKVSSSSFNMINPSEKFSLSNWWCDNSKAIDLTINSNNEAEITKKLDFTGVHTKHRHHVEVKKGKKYKVGVVAKTNMENSKAIIFVRTDDNEYTFLPAHITSTEFQEVVSSKVYTPSKDTRIVFGISSTHISVGETITIKALFIQEVESDDELIKYSKYENNTIDIPSFDSMVLRGFLDGSKDTLSISGEYTQNIGVLQLTSSQSWGIANDTKEDTIVFALDFSEAKENTMLMCNKFSASNGDIEDYEKMSILNNVLYIAINKSRLEEETINGFKSWLDKNGLYLYYEMKNPVTAQLGKIGQLFSYNGRTAFEIVSNVPAEISVIVPCENV